MSGWTVADGSTNKSLPVGGTNNSGVGVAFTAPAPGNQDPVGKMRVSTPQALIDTDFEYGTQPTKWETIGLQNNRQSCYYFAQAPLVVTAIAGTSTADVVTLTITGTVAANTPIYIQNSTNSTINGWGYTVAGGTTTVSVQLAPGSSTTTNGAAYFNPALTYVYTGSFFSNCGIQVGINAVTVTSATVLTINTTGAHGLSRGSYVYIVGLGGGAAGVTGAFVVATVPQANQFTVTTVGASGTPTNSAGNVNIYARPAGYVEPRTFDGGVSFTAGGGVPNQQLIRQTRRYFRYQSGKGIQWSTGTSMKPALFVTQIQSASTTATVTTRYNHNLAVGAQIQVVGCIQGAYNGTWTVATVVSPTSFTYVMNQAATASPATGDTIRISPLSWYGSVQRVGMMDQQNGMFFEFDGQTLYAVLRNSINQVNGTVAVTQGSGTVSGTGTQFLAQLTAGDFIVIRGQSYRVLTIVDNTTLSISPEYRGATLASGAVISKTIDFKYPQSVWSDPLNGTGPSGYTLDLTRMQMWYIDYSWYGAGVVRYGFRATNGQINYVFQIQNNNKQFEAFMRSGNMASHYESTGLAPVTNLADTLGTTTTTSADITDAATSIPLTSATNFPAAGYILIGSEIIFYSGKSGNTLTGCVRSQFGTAEQNYANGTTVNVNSITVVNPSAFPASGTVKVTGNGVSGAVEYIAYARQANGYLVGLTRAQTGGSGSAQVFTYSATSPITVEYGQTDTVPSLSHWGSSVIMDGQFNDDKSLIFNFGTVGNVNVGAGTTVPILALRIAPSVDNGTIGTLGNKEIINRMQLQLVELGVITSGSFLIQMVLNGYTTGTATWTPFSPPTQNNTLTSSLAQVASQSNIAATFTGGESVAAAFTNSSGQTTLDLSQVRDLGNSILGGGTSNTVPTGQAGQYPDGPDVLYVVATNVGAAAANIIARLSWKEAQA
jgi:hypothetical protein